MELPIARQSYRSPAPAEDVIVRAVKRTQVMLARIAAEEEDLGGATAFTNDSRPGVRMVNFAAELALDEAADASDAVLQADALLDRIDTHFQERGLTCHSLEAAQPDWPAPLAQAAAGRGYQPQRHAVYVLDNFTPPQQLNDKLQIIPGRAAYGHLHRFYQDMMLEKYGDEDLAEQLADVHIDFLDEPRVESFLGRLDRQSVGHVSLTTLGQIGVIDDVYTRPSHRRQHVAGTLMSHAIDQCRRALFEHVILPAPASDEKGPAEDLYESLGFRPAAVFERFVRESRG